jgi:Icc-related predicted phosphoesterase
MKFQIMSDIHTEHHAYNHLPELVSLEADALILAGDIVTPSSKYKLKCLKVPVYFLMGNHEFYGGHFENSIIDYREYFKDSNIHVFEDRMMIIPGTNIRIIGSTLWTDFIIPTVVGKEHQGAAVCRGLSDYVLIREITVGKCEQRHKKSLNFIKKCLAVKHGGPTIVMTHHGPSLKSINPVWKNSPINGGFCSDLDYVIEEFQPEIWVHGHVHTSFDYKIGKTRVLANPRGYPHELNQEFNPNLIIEV